MTTNASKRQSKASGRVSLHDTILKDVQQKIVSGEWPPGHRIPFETDMAKLYGCSRMTVNKALTQLSLAGLLDRNKKWGTFVRAPHTISAALEITNIRKEVEDSGKDYSYELLLDRHRQVRKREAQLLDLEEDATIRQLRCLHYSDSQPFCFEDRIVNPLAAPEIEHVKFDADSPSAWMAANVPWNSAEHQIVATAADDRISKTLEIPAGSVCLVIERKTQNDKGYVTWARLAYPGDKHRLIANFTPTS
ncbi:MAG: histidine utilization repressor [Rhizobiaceae bacterium]|jgi:GntR family histidine utilization transcriptional repressor|nr:histidine utilization repressor [Rhizobiaceae bacterium]